MGNCASRPTKSIHVGISNRMISRLLNTHQLHDHLDFECKFKKNSNECAKKPLDRSIELFEYSVYRNLFGNNFSDDYNDYINKIPEEEFQSDLASSKYNQNLFIDYNNYKTNMYLCNHNMYEIDENIGIFTNLISVELCCNYLSNIPSSIMNLVNLKVLILSKNRLTELPNEIGDLRYLQELDVSNNRLKTLPSSFSGLQQLTNLNISENCFEKLPEVLGTLEYLKILAFQNNRIKSIPFSILKLPFLTGLLHSGNMIKTDVDVGIKKEGEMSLKEIIGREIIRNCYNINKGMSVFAKKYLLKVEECGFCKGPLFDSYYTVKGLQMVEGQQIVTEYKMCSKHYESHTERLHAMFSFGNETYPHGLDKYRILSILQLFQISSYATIQIETLSKTLDDDYTKVPILYLAIWNSRYYQNINISPSKYSSTATKLCKKNTKNENYFFYYF